MGVTYQTVAQWENDFRNPKPDTLQRIASALDVPVWTLSGVILLDDLERLDNISPEGREFASKQWADIGSYVYGNLFGLLIHQAGRGDFDVKELAQSVGLQDQLFEAFAALNTDGQTVAVERVEELAEIPKYRRQDSAPETDGQGD